MATTKTQEVQIRPLDIQVVPIRIVGDTPLIVHAWSEKARKMMLETQMKTTKTKAKAIREPFSDFVNSLYWLTEKPEKDTPEEFEKALKNGAKFGFPVGAIKQASNSTAYRLGWVKNQMGLRGAYFLKTEFGEMAEIKGDAPIMREDMVRLNGTSADLRYRGEFKQWFMDLTLEFNASGDVTLEQIINCLNAGGYANGIGEWRPERDGSFGKYHIEIDKK